MNIPIWNSFKFYFCTTWVTMNFCDELFIYARSDHLNNFNERLTPSDGYIVQPSSAVAVVESINTSEKKRISKICKFTMLPLRNFYSTFEHLWGHCSSSLLTVIIIINIQLFWMLNEGWLTPRRRITVAHFTAVIARYFWLLLLIKCYKLPLLDWRCYPSQMIDPTMF